MNLNAEIAWWLYQARWRVGYERDAALEKAERLRARRGNEVGCDDPKAWMQR